MDFGAEMTIGERLKEERQRAGLSQPALAAIAGASKSAVISWEKGASAPTATALAELANAGMDVLYVVTGKRAPERSDDDFIGQELDEIERQLLEPQRMDLENQDQTDQRITKLTASKLKNYLKHDLSGGHPEELFSRAKSLLDIAENPEKLHLYRAADFAQKHQDRQSAEELLEIWFKDWPYQPSDYSVTKQLVMLSMEYNVPYKVLVELSNAIYQDIEELRQAEAVLRRHSNDANGRDDID